MAQSTSVARLDKDLFEAARAAGARAHRSATQQLSYWARLGRELEGSGALSARDIDRALAGQLAYDDLGDRDQAAARAARDERIEAGIEGLDLAAEFTVQGRRWSEADEHGRLVQRSADDAEV